MADLKQLGREIAQPSAPNLKAASTSIQGAAPLLNAASQTIGGVIKANRELEGKALLSFANTELEKSFIQYKNNQNINMDTLMQYQSGTQAQMDGFLAASPRGIEKELSLELKELSKHYYNKALDATLSQSLKNETRDISLSINESQGTLAKQIQNGDYESALKTRENIGSMIQSLASKGANAKTLIKISESTDALGISASYKARLKSATSSEQRKAIALEALNLPDTPVNVIAANDIYKEYKRLELLNKEADDLTVPTENILSGQNYLNLDLDKSSSNKLVTSVAKNIANKNTSGQPQDVSPYQAVPVYKGQEKTYDYEEELRAEKESRKPNLYLKEGYIQNQETPAQREPGLFELAQAHALVGSKNATEFKSAVTNRLYGANGEEVNKAVEAISFVEQTNAESLELDDKADILYTQFKIAKNNGEKDYQKIIDDARKSLKDAEKSLKINAEMYKSEYGLGSEKGRKNLIRAFKDATGVDPIKSESTIALNEYDKILKSKYILANGNDFVAQEATRKQINRAHGVDNFTGGHFVYFAPTKVATGLTEPQIANQFIYQIIEASRTNDTLKYPKAYDRVLSASDTDLMQSDFRPQKEIPFTGVPDVYQKEITVTQHIDGVGEVEGTFFVKPNALTEQNNLGLPVWEAWMRDDKGREYPIIDDKSPYKNTLLVMIKSAKDFAPEYIKNLTEIDIQKAVDKALAEEGKSIYMPKEGFWMNPLEEIQARKNMSAYKNDLENKARIESKVRKILGADEEK